MNPFNPSMGYLPQHLVGREDDLDEVAYALDSGSGALGRVSLFTGVRGIGKTTMLTAIGEEALQRGWYVIDDYATAGLLDRITDALHAIAGTNSNEVRRVVTGASVSVTGLSLTSAPVAKQARSLRSVLTSVIDSLPVNQGVLITVDEVQASNGNSRSSDELRELGNIIQLLIREQRDIAAAFAGLPSSIRAILSDDRGGPLTFLRRALRFDLGPVPLTAVEEAIRATIIDAGGTIDDECVETAAAATGGYPFLIQLIGYYTWRSAKAGNVTATDVTTGIAAARRRLGNLVHDTALADLSSVDKTFLLAMATDDGPCQMKDIQTRMGVDRLYAGKYRQRLIAAGMIIAPAHGQVDFALPYMREFLRTHGASLGIEL